MTTKFDPAIARQLLRRNYQVESTVTLLVCDGLHDKSEPCEAHHRPLNMSQVFEELEITRKELGAAVAHIARSEDNNPHLLTKEEGPALCDVDLLAALIAFQYKAEELGRTLEGRSREAIRSIKETYAYYKQEIDAVTERVERVHQQFKLVIGHRGDVKPTNWPIDPDDKQPQATTAGGT